MIDTRYKTIEDFDTKADFDAYITAFCLSKLFVPLTDEEKENRINFLKKRSYSSRRYRKQLDFDVKFYITKSIAFQFPVCAHEYKLNPNYQRYHHYNDSQRRAVTTQQEELINCPMDIFLALTGFDTCAVSYTKLKARSRYYKACQNPKELRAWLLGHPHFRLFNSSYYHDKTFEETLVEIQSLAVADTHFDIADAYNRFIEIYKLHQPWKVLTK